MRARAAAAGAALLVAAWAPPAAGQAPALPDGGWNVVFFHQLETESGGVEIRYTSHGSALIDVTGDSAVGDWDLSVRSFLPETATSSNAVAVGEVSGDARTQALDLTEVTVTEAQLGVTITMSAAELPDTGAGSLTATGGGCGALIGEWSVPFGDTVLEGEYIATALGETWGEDGIPNSALRDEGLDLIDAAREGTIDAAALRDYLGRAEALSGTTSERPTSCTGSTGRTFATSATLLLDLVLTEAAFALDSFDDREFIEFYRMALRSGVFDFHPEVRSVWHDALLQRIATVITTGSVDDLRFWLPVALQLGEEEAAAALTTRICETADEPNCEDDE